MSKLLKFIATAIVIFTAPGIAACEKDRIDRDPLGVKIFSLLISRSFHTEVIFQLWENCDEKTLRIRVGTNKQELKMDVESYEKILIKFNKAQESNIKDVSAGIDGSLWCLDNYEFENSEFHAIGTISCFWSPIHDPETRKLEGLSELGQYLWSMPNMKLLEGELY